MHFSPALPLHAPNRFQTSEQTGIISQPLKVEKISETKLKATAKGLLFLAGPVYFWYEM